MFYVNFIYKFCCLLIYWTSFDDADVFCVGGAEVKINPKIGNQSMSHPWQRGVQGSFHHRITRLGGLVVVVVRHLRSILMIEARPVKDELKLV